MLRGEFGKTVLKSAKERRHLFDEFCKEKLRQQRAAKKKDGAVKLDVRPITLSACCNLIFWLVGNSQPQRTNSSSSLKSRPPVHPGTISARSTKRKPGSASLVGTTASAKRHSKLG